MTTKRVKWIVGIVLIMLWVIMLFMGSEIDSKPARRVLASTLGYRGEAAATEAAASQSVPLDMEIRLAARSPAQPSTLNYTNSIIITNATPVPVQPAPALGQLGLNEGLRVLCTILFAWMWPNLVWIGACASSIGALWRAPQNGENGNGHSQDMWGLLGLGLLNGLCLAALLACIRIIAGTGLAEAVGLGRAEIMSQRHIELAFLVTAAGVVLGYSGTTPVGMFDFLRRLVLRAPAKAAPHPA